MNRALLVLFVCTSCTRHPAITVGVAAGSVGLLSCEINGAPQTTCAIITGSVGVFLGGLAALVTYFADTSEHELPPDVEIAPDNVVHVHTHTEPPPGVIDAGVDAETPSDATVDQS